MQSKSYQEALQVYGASPAYQKALAELLTREAQWIADRIGINARVSPNLNYIGPPQHGINGSASSGNYYFTFAEGVLRQINWADWFSNLKPPVTDMLEFARRPSLLDGESALILARTWLTNIGVDIPALEAKATASVFQPPAKPARQTLPGETPLMRPHFIITWAGPNQTLFPGGPRVPAGRPPRPGSGAVVVEILGTTKQLIDLRVEDPTLWSRPKLELKDAATLLGSDPSPADLMARILTPGIYRTIAEADTIEAWLITSRAHGPKKDRHGPALLNAALAKDFADALLDLDSYNDFNSRLGCITDDGARLLIRRGPEEVHIAFCFECHILTLRAAAFRKELNFNRGHDCFADLLLKTFPNDAVLRSIPRKQK